MSHKAVILKNRNKLSRGHEAVPRMNPAHQSLRPDQPAIKDIVLGLVPDLELPLIDGFLHIFQNPLGLQGIQTDIIIVEINQLIVFVQDFLQRHHGTVAHDTDRYAMIHRLINAVLLHKGRQPLLNRLVLMQLVRLLLQKLLVAAGRMRQQLDEGCIIQAPVDAPFPLVLVMILRHIAQNSLSLLRTVLLVDVGQIHHMGAHQVKILLRIPGQKLLRQMQEIIPGIAVGQVVHAQHVQHDGLLMEGYGTLQAAQQHIRIKWLGYKVRGTGLQAACLLLRGIVAGQHQHRNHPHDFILLELPQELIAVHHRHIQVHQDNADIRAVIFQIFQCLKAIFLLNCLVMLLKEIAQGSPLQIRVIHHQHRLVPHQLAFLHGKLRFLVQLTLMLLINITGTQENHLPVSLVVPGGDNLNHFPPVPAALGTAIGNAQIFLAACQLRPQLASFQKAGKFLGILCVDHTGLSCPGSHSLIILAVCQQPLNIRLIALDAAEGIVCQIDIYYCMINISYQP